MRRFVIALSIAITLFAGATVPVYAASLPLLDPSFHIVPEANDYDKSCPVGAPLSYGASLQLVQNAINTGVSIGVIAMILVIAYAGATFMLSPTNPESRTKARSMLINVAVGLVILLAAWLVVDFIMKTLYNPNTTSEGVKYGPWNEILAPTSADSWCIKQTSSTPIPGVAGGILGGVLGSPAGNGSASTATKKGSAVGVTKGLCSDGNTACSVAAIKALGLNDAQAQTMSCIAVTESGGNPQTPDSKSGACGTFQITNRPGNWSNPAFHQPPCSTSSSCNSATCNLQTAVIMFKKQGYQPWTGKNPDGTYWNANAVACKMKYNPGS